MRTRSCPPLGTIVLAALLVGSGASLASAVEIVEGQKKARQAKLAAPWLDLVSGLKKSRKSQQPIVLLYTAAGGAADSGKAGDTRKNADLARTFETYLRDSGFKRTLRGYVLIGLGPDDLDKPFPPRVDVAALKKGGRRRNAPARRPVPRETVRQKLVLHAEKSTLLILSFREQVVGRYLDELPKRSALRKKLARITKVNRVLVKEDRRVGAILEKSLYAFEVGKRKAAVALVLPFTKPSSRRRMDDTLKSRVDGVINGYRKVAATEMKKGDLLDRKQKYKEALDVFEVVLQDFSFPDIRKQAAIRKGEVWRKVQLITRIPR